MKVLRFQGKWDRVRWKRLKRSTFKRSVHPELHEVEI